MSLDPKAPWKLHAYAEFLLTKVGDYEAASHYAARAFDVMQHPRFAQLLALAAYTKWADFYANRGRNFRPFDASSKPLERATASAPQARRLGELTGLAPEDAFVAAAHHLMLGFVAEALLDAGAVRDVDHRGGPCNCTALALAAEAGNAKLVERLIARKASFDLVDENGITPLLMAAWNGRTDVVRALLKNGARPNAVDRAGDAAIHGRMSKGNNEIVELLLRNRADPDIPRRDGNTLLCFAAIANDVELAQLLLRYRADPNKRCDRESALATALSMGSHTVVQMLLDAGADPSAVPDILLRTHKAQAPETVGLILAARAAREAPRSSAETRPGSASDAK